ncbi:MAG: DUF2953 domain-containing protein [Peptococcaceae bacterium]|nr:DUF2953 domain-containing protein [Peptococcaceae bacterium]
MTLMIMGLTRKLKSRSEKEFNRKKDGKPAKNKKRSDFRTYLKTEIIQKAISCFCKILKHCRPEILSVQARIGFNDPMYTGFLCALISQFYVLTNPYDIMIQPVFDEEVIEGRFSIGGRIWLPYLIVIIIGFLFTKPMRNILFFNKKKKNKGGLQYAG